MPADLTQDNVNAFYRDLEYYRLTFSIAYDDLSYCNNILRQKLKDGNYSFDNPVLQFYIRTFLRTLMASFECITYLSKQLLLSFNKNLGITLSDIDFHFINETRINSTGAVVEQHLELKDNFKGVFKTYNRIFNNSIVLDCNAIEYHQFLQTIQIRHNLTHPKQHNSFIVSIDDFDKIANTYTFYDQKFTYLFSKIKEGLTSMNLQVVL